MVSKIDYVSGLYLFELSLRRSFQRYLERRLAVNIDEEYEKVLTDELVVTEQECKALEDKLQCHLLKRAARS